MKHSKKKKTARFKKRLKERYDLKINNEGIRTLLFQIQNGFSTYIGKISKTKSVHDVLYLNTRIRVACSNKKVIVTAFEPNWNGVFRSKGPQKISPHYGR